MNYSVSLTAKSRNVKTGPIPVSTTTAASCPDVCPFKKAGCYADGGPLAIHWAAVTAGTRGTTWAEFCEEIAALPDAQLWRHNQAGDLPGDGVQIDAAALYMLAAANADKRGFTYTHYDPAVGFNGDFILAANLAGFTINLSANNGAHADELAELNIGPVVVVLPIEQTENSTTPAGRKIVVCPAAVREDVSCATCQLCQRAGRETIIGFPAHGAGKKKAEHAITFFKSI